METAARGRLTNETLSRVQAIVPEYQPADHTARADGTANESTSMRRAPGA